MNKREYTYRHTTLACYRGYITQAIINNLAPLLFIVFQTHFSISYQMLGQLVLINFAVQLLTDIWATKYADRFGYRSCMVFAHALACIGLLSLGILPMLLPSAYTGIVISVILYAIGGGLLEVVVSPIIEALPSENKEASMSLLHSFYCWGQLSVVLLSTFLLWLIGRDFWFLLPILWSIFPLYNMFRFRQVPILPLIQEGKEMSLKELLKSPVFYLSMMLMVCAGASELTMSQWSSFFAEKGLQIPKIYGDILGPGLFALLMAIGRLLYGIFADRLPIKASMLASSILCVTTYLVSVFSPYPILSLLACGLCGLSVSLMWPGTFSLTSSAFPRGGTMMFGILAIFGDLGCSLGPWMAGFISDSVVSARKSLNFWSASNLNLEQIGLRSGLLAATAFPLIMAIGLIVFRRKKNSSIPPTY